MPAFQLHPQLAVDTLAVTNLPLSTVLLMNDRRFPWCILVPRHPDLVDLIDLTSDAQTTLWQEIDTVSRVLKAVFNAEKLNVAALGNVVPQLHIHVIARFQNDAAWPKPVWGIGTPEPYTRENADAVISRTKAALAP
jgi:diadenosine tetraphosphate (Ap4A) HIT family hydrolase